MKLIIINKYILEAKNKSNPPKNKIIIFAKKIKWNILKIPMTIKKLHKFNAWKFTFQKSKLNLRKQTKEENQ